MALFFPLLDTALAFLLLAGSPAIGYVILRCVIFSSKYWQGWKRLLVASVVGGGWAYSVFAILSPLVQTNASVNVNALIEYFAYAGMGLFALTTIASLASRLVIARALAGYFPARSMMQTPSPAPRNNVVGEMMYKPSQLRAKSSNTPSPFAEPTLENDVLSLLKQENFDSDTKKTKKARRDSDEIVADNPDENEAEESAPERKRAPMEDMGEFAGFEETLTQLKRDLKDFNENVTRPAKRRGH